MMASLKGGIDPKMTIGGKGWGPSKDRYRMMVMDERECKVLDNNVKFKASKYYK